MTNNPGWRLVSDSYVNMDEVLILEDEDGPFIGSFIYDADADGWIWCECYGDLTWFRGKWTTDEAIATERVPLRWHPLPKPEAKPCPK